MNTLVASALLTLAYAEDQRTTAPPPDRMEQMEARLQLLEAQLFLFLHSFRSYLDPDSVLLQIVCIRDIGFFGLFEREVVIKIGKSVFFDVEVEVVQHVCFVFCIMGHWHLLGSDAS